VTSSTPPSDGLDSLTLSNVSRELAVTGYVYIAALEAVMRRTRGVASGRRRPPTCPADASSHSKLVMMYRARARLRRYAVANALEGFVTLTTEGGEALQRAVTGIIRRTRDRIGPFPYAWTLERGIAFGRLHAHLLAPWIPASSLASEWDLGFTDIKRLASSEERRTAAVYMARDFDRPVMRQRYIPAKGYKPEATPVAAHTRDEFVAIATDLIGSTTSPRVLGPPADDPMLVTGQVLLEWDDPPKDSQWD